MASFDEAKLTSTLRGSFSTYNPTSGANKNADSTPTALVYKLSDGTTLAAAVTVTNITTGVYRFSVGVTTANGFAAGEYYELWVTAAVSGDTTVTQSAPIINFKATTNDVDALATPTNITAGTITTTTNLTNAPTSGDLTATMKASVTAAVPTVASIQSGLATPTNITAATGITVSSIGANVVNASALAADAVAEIQSGLATPTNITAGTITTVTNLTNAPTSGDLTSTMKASVTAAVPTVVQIQSGLATPTNITAGTITTVTNLTNAPTSGDLTATMKSSVTTAVPTVSQTADQVWDELLSGHTTVGSTGAALSAAGSAGDPWSTALPGAYGAGTAGKIVGDNVNATISSRASQTSLDTLDDVVDTEVAAIKTKTDQLVFTVANQVDSNSLSVSATGIRTAVGLATANLDTQIATLATPTNITAGTITTTTNLTNAPTSGDLTATMKASVTSAVPTVASIQSGLATPTNITAASGITVSSIGANVVNASALAADAVAEIQSGLATPTNITAITGNITGNLSGSVGSVTGAVGSVTGAVGSVTAAVTVGTINANVVNASALAADAVAEIQSGLATPTNITAATGITVSSIGANVVNASALAADAVAEIQSGLSTLTQTQVTGGAYAINNASFAFNTGLDFTTTQKASVNAEVLDVMNVDTFAELAAPPAATSSLRAKLTWLFMWARNKSTQTSTERKLFADDTTTIVGTETVGDSAGVFTKGEAS